MKAPAYRAGLGTGIVHFGPGAFHRAHQADYVDRLLRDDPRWGIAAVSLRTANTVEALKAQAGLYTLAVLDREVNFRSIGAHSRFLGPRDGAAVRAQLLDPAVRIVTSTVTEKGYCLGGDGTLDFGHPDIVHDLDDPARPISLIGWLALGLHDRRVARLAPFTPVCCDNMASNGTKLRNAVVTFAERLDRHSAGWIADEVRFPETMVDSITPATDDDLLRLVEEKTGWKDSVPVAREAFSQWVIEDILPSGSPELDTVGVTLTAKVSEWEQAKLRILNGAHSTLAYVGLSLGHETVADAMRDGRLASFLKRLVVEDIVPTLEPTSIDLQRYVEETVERFRNPSINHRLAQIAWDGSQKLPYRLLGTIADLRSLGRSIDRLAIPIAAWMIFLEQRARSRAAITDPLAERLSAIALSDGAVEGFLALRQVFPEKLASDAGFRNSVSLAFERIKAEGMAETIDVEMVRA